MKFFSKTKRGPDYPSTHTPGPRRRGARKRQHHEPSRNELTARENIYVSSSVLGLRIREIDRIFDKIIDFGELREFMDAKIKYFSSGMVDRLGFSTHPARCSI